MSWAGDGCFLAFAAPSAAVPFALRLQQAHADEPELPEVRTGIHMGEVSERRGADGDVEGLAVDLSSRICGLAEPVVLPWRVRPDPPPPGPNSVIARPA